jgi:stringent starvation protein B
MSRQFWSETIAWATASGTAIANTTTETILFPNVTIPANYLQDGRALRLRAFGAFGTVVTTNPSLTFSLRWGGVAGTVIAKSAALLTSATALGGGASMTATWELEAVIQTRSNGSAGTLMTNGAGALFSGAQPTYNTVTAYGMPFMLVSGSTGGSTPVAVTADLTADTALSLTATWSAANAAISIQGLNYTIETLN